MDAKWKGIIWRQFGAAIDMLGNAIAACPDELWTEPLMGQGTPEAAFSQFSYVAYHALFFLDFYSSESAEGFQPPAPFGLEELDPAGVLPPRVFSREELTAYLAYGRIKCRMRIDALTDEFAMQRCRADWHDVTVGELLLDNMRHVQEHAAQLNLFLGQRTGSGPGWVRSAASE